MIADLLISSLLIIFSVITLSELFTMIKFISSIVKALKHSIIWERFHSNKNRGVKLFTDPDMFKFSNRQYGRNFCYAAIHNEGGKIAKPGSPASYIRQRQFIGYSTTVADKITSYSIRIFDGFPK